jgi:hypothetical protein
MPAMSADILWSSGSDMFQRLRLRTRTAELRSGFLRDDVAARLRSLG